ncbi:phage tail tape measure protein [Streptomyces coelicoflavus]|uniref:phage tail tape measure protein n=1 Tax=Streptomyces coelicoflavus TaxID=285562 RepID=UPI00324BA577
MALTVGELTAFITVDNRAVAPSLRRAENALRASGQTMGSDAERAGQQAGQRLGEGLVRGADGQWRNMRGDLVDASTAAIAEAERVMRQGGRRIGEETGDALGDGLADAGGQGAARAGQSITDKLGGLKLAAAGVGASAGAFLMSAFSEALDQSTITARLGAQLGTTPPVAKQYGKIAGQLFTGAVVDSFQDGADAIRAVAGSGLFPPGATNAQLQSIATKAADLANAFDVDVSEAAQAAGIAVKTGLAKNSTEAFDLITKGMVGLGKDSEDLLETISEYGVQFAKSGLSGRTAVGLMRQAIQAGWKDTDKLADAFKELELRVTGGGKAQVEALQSIGLNADQMIAALSAGGQRGEDAMAQIHDAIVELGPGSNVAKKAIQDLFGGPGEDLGAAFFKLNLHEAQKAMGNVAGESDRLGKSLRENAGTRVKQFQRGMQQGLVDFLGGTVIPGIEVFGTKLGGIWDKATAGLDGASLAAKLSAFVPMLGDAIASKVATIGPKIAEGLAMAGSRAAEWAMANPTAFLKVALLAAAFLAAIAFLPELLIAGVAATVGLIIGGFVAKLIQAAQVKLPEWGEAISDWFGGLWSKYVSGPISRTWNSLVSSVKELPGRTLGALAALGSMLASAAARHWQRFSTATAQKVVGFISWVRGLPGRIARAIGNLGSLLYGKGADVVRGLWNGIKSMGSWLKSTLIGWAKNMIPGPIAKALGISSPSKVMAKSVGRWIPAGVAKGIEDNAGVVDRTMSNLVDTPTPSMTMSASMGAAASGGPASRGGAVKTVQLTGGDDFGEMVVNRIRKQVDVGGGNVQFVLGR